jgi:hypothetical protein
MLGAISDDRTGLSFVKVIVIRASQLCVLQSVNFQYVHSI